MYQLILFNMQTGREVALPYVATWRDAMLQGAALSNAGFIFFLREV